MGDQVPDLNKIGGIARNLELISANWRELNVRRFVEQDEIVIPMTLDISHGATVARVEDRNQLLVLARFKFLASTPGEERKRPVVTVEATLALRYQSTKEFLSSISVDDAQEFANVNGIYNAWPYWREALQCAASRVGLHGIVAPLLKIPTTSKTPRVEREQTDEMKLNSAQG